MCYCRESVHSRYLFRASGACYQVQSDAGVDQGDSLAPVLFSFGVQKPVRALLAELLRKASQLQGDKEVLVLLYLDDVYVFTPPALAGDVVPLAASALGEGLGGVPGAGLTLRVDKCAAWSPSGVRPSLPPLVSWCAEPLVVLGSSLTDPDTSLQEFLFVGAPVATESGCVGHWDKCVETALSLADRVLDLYRNRDRLVDKCGEPVLNTVQCCQLLFRSCVESKLLHLLRAYSTTTLGDRPSLVDRQLQDLWQYFLEGEFSSDQRVQLALPVSRGGFGVGSLSLRHAAAYLGSWTLCLQPVLERLPQQDASAFRNELAASTLGFSTCRFMAHACQQLGELGVAAEQLPVWPDFFSFSLQHGQRVFARKVMASTYSRLLNRLDEPGRARLRSCSGVGAGAFLLCVPSDTVGTELLDAAFLHGVRWRLGLQTCATNLFCARCYSSNLRKCCGKPLDYLGDHLLCCNVGGYKTYLHSRVVAVVRGILRDSGASVPDREVEVLPWGKGPGQAARLEVEYTVAGARRHVDVVVKHPRAAHLVRRASDQDGAAAAEGERDKLQRYPALPHVGLREVVPFALESFGRLGPAGLRLLKEARHRVVASDGRFDTWFGHALVQRWHARVSCALVAGLWDAAAASWGFCGSRAGLWEDVADGTGR